MTSVSKKAADLAELLWKYSGSLLLLWEVLKPKGSATNFARKRPSKKNQGRDWVKDQLSRWWKKSVPAATVLGALWGFVSDYQAEGHREARNQSLLKTITSSTGLITNFLKQIVYTQKEATESITRNLTSIHKELRDISASLESFHRAQIWGQVTTLSVMAAAVYEIKRLVDLTERISNSVAGIEVNLESANARGNSFPDDVHLYVQMMIESYANAPVPHYFTIFNRGTLWHAKFAELQRQFSLGPHFLGHKTDLDELCAFLAEEVRPRVGPKPVLHIIMPTVGPLAITEAISFPEAMRPFQVDGQSGHDGAPFVWLCTPNGDDKRCLKQIGALKQREIWGLVGEIGLPFPFLSEYLSIRSRVSYFVDPSWRVNTVGSFILAGFHYVRLGLEPPRILGQPATRPWEENNTT